MKPLRLLMVLMVLSFAGCQKVSHSGYFQAFLSRATPQPAAVSPRPSQPEPVAEGPTEPEIDRTAQVIALGYHRFVDKVRRPDTEITPAEFEGQMQALKDQGITVISMDDFLAWRRGQKSIPKHSALITIDDGFNVAYSVAWPILKKFGYPFTMFIYTDYVRGGPKSGGGSMTWDQLAEMRDAGVSIQSHTVSHPDLRRKKAGMTEATYDAWLWNELHGSKVMLEDHLGIKVTALALPFGLANDRVREAAAKAGYEMIFTVNGQKISFRTPMESLNRYMVQANQPKLFTTATAFEGGAGSSATAVAEFPVRSIHPEPADGATIGDPNPLIKADLTRLGAIEPGSVSLRVSGLGEVACRFDLQTKVLTYKAQALPPSQYTVILNAKVEGKKVECRWNFTVTPPSTVAPKLAARPPR